MKLRHHRKHRTALGLARAAFVRVVKVEAWYRMVAAPRRTGKTSAALQWNIYDEDVMRHLDQHFIDAVKYGFSVMTQDFEPTPPTTMELAAQEVVQDTERFDRTLDHYVRPGELEAIPMPHHMATSRRYYEQRMREACAQYGPEVRIAARRYSTSVEYGRWLRENPPKERP